MRVFPKEHSRFLLLLRKNHPMKTALFAGISAAALATASFADVTYTLTNQTFTGFNFMEVDFFPWMGGPSIIGASINITLNASTNYTYADDLCVYIAGSPLALGGMLQCGGFSNLGAAQRYFWPNGNSSAPGTTSIGTVMFTTHIDMVANPSLRVWIGNGYGAAGTSGTFTGTITLHTPAPGAFALLGLAGLSGRRRR